METARVALITGAMSCLGTALCRGLAKAGFRIAATYQEQNSRAEAWLANEREAGFPVRAYALDVSDYGACEWMVQRVLHDMGSVDVLINQAQQRRDRYLLDMAHQDWEAVLRVNLDGAFHMAKQVIEPMRDRGWGRIVNIASVGAQQGAAGSSNDAAAKAGMHGLTKSLALEVARHGITVNTVSPGHLRTPRTMDMPLATAVLPRIPVGRLGEPHEVAAMVAYVCSDAAGFLTGANLAINGGEHMS